MIDIFRQMAQAEAQRRAVEENLRRAQHAASTTPKARANLRAQFDEFERICRETVGSRPHANSGPFSISQGR